MPRMKDTKRAELEAFWRSLLEGWTASDLNQREYCVAHGLPLKRFGGRSERLDSDQMLLGLEDLDADIALLEADLPTSGTQPKAKPASQPEERPGLPDHLEREEVRLDFEVDICPGCGGSIHPISETVSEMLD